MWQYWCSSTKQSLLILSHTECWAYTGIIKPEDIPYALMSKIHGAFHWSVILPLSFIAGHCLTHLGFSWPTWAQLVKNPPAMWDSWVRSLGWEDSPEEGKGYPLQYSCLDNSMDCIVHRVAKNQTWWRDFQFHFTFTVWPTFLGHWGTLRISSVFHFSYT